MPGRKPLLLACTARVKRFPYPAKAPANLVVTPCRPGVSPCQTGAPSSTLTGADRGARGFITSRELEAAARCSGQPRPVPPHPPPTGLPPASHPTPFPSPNPTTADNRPHLVTVEPHRRSLGSFSPPSVEGFKPERICIIATSQLRGLALPAHPPALSQLRCSQQALHGLGRYTRSQPAAHPKLLGSFVHCMRCMGWPDACNRCCLAVAHVKLDSVIKVLDAVA